MKTFLILVYTKYFCERWVITDQSEEVAIKKVKNFYGMCGSMTLTPQVKEIHCILLPDASPTYLGLDTIAEGTPVR